MNGSHSVVGFEGLIPLLIFLAANYYIIFLIVSHVMKNSRLKEEINELKSELKDLRQYLKENKQ